MPEFNIISDFEMGIQGISGDFMNYDNYTHNIDANPLWLNPSQGNGYEIDASSSSWYLQENSPCIDAGSPLNSYDEDGTISDIGAFTIDMLQASILVNPTDINFGDIQIGVEAIETFNIENTGTVDLEISQITGTENFTLSYEESGSYAITLPEITIPPGGNTNVFIKFYSVYTQSYSEPIIVSSNAANDTEFEIPVSANCIYTGVNPLSNKLVYNYPNPITTKTTFYLNISTNKEAKLEIIDCYGAIIDILNISVQTPVEYNTTKLSSGLYFYRITTNGQTITKKMIKY